MKKSQPTIDLHVQRSERSRLAEVDFGNLGFGNIFSDHMFSMRFVQGTWQAPEILPYASIRVEPGCLALHYGQSVFEGLKAYRGIDGHIRVFRPDRNDQRLRASCARLCIPPLPDGMLEFAIRELIRLDHRWIPGKRGEALYLRPLIFAEESHLEVRPARHYRFLLFSAPVRNYFANEMATIGLKVQEKFSRAAPGGVGFAKTAGNYAASLLPALESNDEGFSQALWLDGAAHEFVEEVGHMNIFFHMGKSVVTPALSGAILPGVTRESVLELLREQGYPTEERRISIREVIAGIEDGSLTEAFGTGTATVVAPVGRLGYHGRAYEIGGNRAGPLAGSLHRELINIQLGAVSDRHGWMLDLGIPAETEPPAS